MNVKNVRRTTRMYIIYYLLAQSRNWNLESQCQNGQNAESRKKKEMKTTKTEKTKHTQNN